MGQTCPASLPPSPALSAAVRSSSAADDPAGASLKATFDYRTILNMLMSIVNSAAPGDMTPLKTPLPKVGVLACGC